MNQDLQDAAEAGAKDAAENLTDPAMVEALRKAEWHNRQAQAIMDEARQEAEAQAKKDLEAFAEQDVTESKPDSVSPEEVPETVPEEAPEDSPEAPAPDTTVSFS